MKSLLTKIFAVLCLAAVTCQATTTNTIAIPLSQLPALGTNPITALDFLPGDNYEGTQYVTVKIPIALLGSNITAGILTNFVTTLNPVITSNPPVTFNDSLQGTNEWLTAYNVGGDISTAAAVSNSVVLLLGDSITEGANGDASTSYVFGQRLRAMFGDGGMAGRQVGYGGGWANNTVNGSMVVLRNPPTNVWWRAGIGLITSADGTNAAVTTAPNVEGNSNVVNQLGVMYVATPQSGGFALKYWSASQAVTNIVNINDNSNAPNLNIYTVNVAPANDWYIGCSSLGTTSQTNYLINAILVNTNHGVQVWAYGSGGYSPADFLCVGSNMWGQMLHAINPNVIVWNSLHYGNSGSGFSPGTDTSENQTTNCLRGILGNCSTNCRVVLVSQPPNVSGDYKALNYFYRKACQNYHWFYADVASCFPDYTTAFNSGLLSYADGGFHPSLNGAYARSAALVGLMGVSPAYTLPLYASTLIGRIPNGSESGNTVTNGQFQPTFNSLAVKTTVPYFQSGIEIDTGDLNNYGGNFHFKWAQTADGIGNLSWNSGYGGTLNITNAAALGSVTTATANAGSVTVTNGISASTVTVTNLCLAGQFGGITQFYVNANGSNSITVPAGKTYFVTWNSARNLNTLIWTNGYGVGSPVTITNLAWPVPGPLILKQGWVLSLYDTSGYPGGGVYYPL